MKFTKPALRFTAFLLVSLALPASALAASPDALVPMGSTVGINLKTNGLVVVGFDTFSQNGVEYSPARDGGLSVGDIIVSVGEKDISDSNDMAEALKALTAKSVVVGVLRQGKKAKCTVSPAYSADGAAQLGVWLRDGLSGIGTVTYYDPQSGSYGALGHGVNDIDSGILLPISGGEVLSSTVTGVTIGKPGTPGQLIGEFSTDDVLGDVDVNCVYGIFGTLNNTDVSSDELLPVAADDEIEIGPAVILSTVKGNEVEQYDIEITRITDGDEQNMMIKVSDPQLIDATGGIAQGMSGSPILQNGKIVGAVTHVLVNDPTRGYGISIENMLCAADAQQKAS